MTDSPIRQTDTRTHAHALHERLTAARRQKRQLDHHIAVLLRQIDDERLYTVFGHASVRQYAEAEHGLTTRQTTTYLLIARKLESMPAIEAAFAAGAIDKTKAREILAIATPDTEAAWLERAVKLTNRALEREIAGSRPGDPPPNVPPGGELRPARVRRVFEMDAAEAELLDQALLWIRLQTGLKREEIDDGALAAILARKILADADGPDAPRGGEACRIVIQSCPKCADTRSGESEISDTLVDEALCDALITDMEPGPAQGHTSRTIPPATRTAVLCAFDWKCAVPGCRHRSFLDIHHLHEQRFGIDHRRENLAPLCPAHHRVLHAGFLAIERQDGALVFRNRTGTIGRTVPTWGNHRRATAGGS